MRTIREKDFEYYEEKASYFQYTHERDYAEENEVSQEYLDLAPGVIETVRKKALMDVKNGEKRMNAHQLEEYLVKEGILTDKEVIPVIDDLFLDYKMECY